MSASNDGASSTDRAEVIRQGKEKAKEVVEGMSSPNAVPNRPQSRKRSRSGSRIANGTDNGSASPPPDPHLAQYILRDQLASQAQLELEQERKALTERLNEEKDMWLQARASYPTDPGWIYGSGYRGYGNGWTAPSQPQQPKLVYPRLRKRPGLRRTGELRYARRDRDAQKDKPEDLVPIRLDLEIDKLRIRDTFTWNLHDVVVPPRLFAEGLVEDFHIAPEHATPFVEQVNQSLLEQLQDFHPYLHFIEEPLDPHLSYAAYKNDDMRILVKLNITIGRHSLVDQFEWDINNASNSPEDFAAHMAADLSLSGEFKTAIAHSIREQTQMFTKGLYIAGHPFDGRPVEDSDLRDNFLQTPLPTVFRPYQAAKEYSPYFFELNETELEKTEDAFLREQRQQKRSINRRGGPSLPDLRERLRTVRTMVVSTVIPGAAETIDDSGIIRPQRAHRLRKTFRGEDAGSDISDSDDSEPRSPVPSASLFTGTARTRNMRGAATAAQVAMRAGYAGSMTPERQEPLRQKRTGGYELREDSETGEPVSLLLRLKMPRERYRRWWREYKQQKIVGLDANQARETLLQLQSARQAVPLGSAAASAARPTPLGRPSSSANLADPSNLTGSPRPPQQPTTIVPSNSSAPTPSAPPAPAWLESALAGLRKRHPEHSFASAMRWNNAVKEWQPRIRCLDCNNNILYKTSEEAPVTNFETHFSNADHITKVREKQEKMAA